MAKYSLLFFLRRRVVLTTGLALTLVVLFILLKHTLGDVDEIGLSAELVESSQYLPFEAARLPLASLPRSSLRPVHDLPVTCLDSYLALGEQCLGDEIHPIDVLWTWVNGSDVLLEEARTLAQSEYSPDDPYRPVRSSTQARLYRDHDELRYSMRSVLANFRAHTSRFRLLTADFPVPEWLARKSNITSPQSWRLGQIPQWLDLNKRTASDRWKDGHVELSITHHAEIFRPYNGTNFNSLAIESQFSHVDDISEYFIYMNDDLFMVNPLSPVSFYTPAFGLVLHLQHNLLVRPDRLFGRNQGEWRSLGESNFLLSKRFGSRHRPYVAHEAKTASRALLHEMAMIWPDSFARTATHLFRETEGGDGDVNTMFMLSHFVVERAREALLWSWIVGHIGDVDDVWGEKEAVRAWAELGGVWGEDELLVQSGWRDTLVSDRVAKVLQDSGHQPQSLTSYVFSSMDGYPYAGLGVTGRPEWPSFLPTMDKGLLPRCRIAYDQCFAINNPDGRTTRASEIFKDIAFRNQKCGDCVIMALVQASGTLGLSAFLPSPELVLFPSGEPQSESDQWEEVPHLPLALDWQDGDFSLRAVMGADHAINVRQWILQLLQRYRFVIGETPSLFERISSPRQTAAIIGRIESTPNVALLCVNDDVTRDNLDHEVSNVLKAWFNRRWKNPAAWEQR